MDQIVEKVSNLNIADSSNNNLKKNQIQVSNTKKPLFFYVNLAKDRRRIESDFFSGKLCGIAATNALELGIDIGHIDATLHLGFPGSVASLWQQAGRSGRRGKPSLAVYVAFEGPLDQYFMKFPHKLFGSAIECWHVDSQNLKVLEQHLVCAAIEHPISLIYDEKYFGPGLNGATALLKNRGYLSFDPSRGSSARIWTYVGKEILNQRSGIVPFVFAKEYNVHPDILITGDATNDYPGHISSLKIK